MKRAIYILVISLITVGCAIFSICRDLEPSDEGSTAVDIDKFDSIIINAEIADITLKEDTDYSIAHTDRRKSKVNYYIDNGKLYIEQKTSKRRLFNKKGSDITVTVPAGITLKLVDATVNVGEFKCDDVNSDECRLSMDVGDVTINRSGISAATIESHVGDVDIKNASFKSLKINSDIGDVDIKSSEDISRYAFDLKTDVGEIEINDKNYSRQYTDNNSSGDNRVQVISNIGDITLDY